MNTARRFERSLALLGLLPLFLLACEVSTGGDGTSSGGPSPTPDGGTVPDDEPSCPTTTSGPTVHKGDIEGNEVWTAATGPHVIEETVNVRGGAKLTIEPCAEVRVKKGRYLQVAYPITPNTGSLVAEGTAKRPIKFVGLDGERWSSVAVHAGGTARFAHVTFDNGGGGDFQNGATLAIYGDSLDGSDPMLFVDHVSVTKSLGTGAWMTRGATFIEGSRDFTIGQSGSDDAPYPMMIEEHAIDALPTGKYTGNKVDEILIEPKGGRMAGTGLLADATLHERGVPYHIGTTNSDSLRIGGREDKKLVTLTIEPGVVMRFTPGSALKVQHFTNLDPSSAALRALGTADKPIVMTSTSATPKPGDWQGLWFGGIPDASNKIDHVQIQNAGADCGCILNTCSAIAQHEGAIIFTAQPPSAFVTNTKFVDIAGHGITQGFDGTLVNFRPSNTFEGVSGCVQTRPRDVDTSCPTPKPACDGM